MSDFNSSRDHAQTISGVALTESGEDFALVFISEAAALEAEANRHYDLAWRLRGENGSYELGFAHGVRKALKALGLLDADTSDASVKGPGMTSNTIRERQT